MIMYTCIATYVYKQDNYVYIIMYTCKIIMYPRILNHVYMHDKYVYVYT